MTTSIAEVNGTHLHYAESGAATGQPIVFSNSLGTDFRIWDDVVDRLDGTFRIVRYDKRGHGLSGSPDGPWSIDDHVQDLADLLDHLSIRRATITGLSVGGLIAQGLALSRPDLVGRLVLCDTASKIGADELWNARIEDVRTSGIEAIADSVLERWFAPEYRSGSRDFHKWRNMLLGASAEGYARTCEAIRDADYTMDAATLRLPALAIVGEFDGATPPDVVCATARLIPGCRFELIRDAGHLPCVEQPAVMAALLSDFVGADGGDDG